MNRAQIQAQLLQTQIDTVAVIHLTEGEQKLYQAAVFSQDGLAAQTHREKMHALLDRQLDLSASVMSLTRMLISATD